MIRPAGSFPKPAIQISSGILIPCDFKMGIASSADTSEAKKIASGKGFICKMVLTNSEDVSHLSLITISC
jgi:hypothetical protein